MGEVKSLPQEEVKEMSMEVALTLGQGIVSLLNSTPQMNGKLVYALGKNEEKLEQYAKKYRKDQAALLKKYGELEENGSFKMKEEKDMTPGGNPFFFKSEEDEQKYEAEATALLKEAIPNPPELHKVQRSLFEALSISPQHNRSFPIIVDYLSF